MAFSIDKRVKACVQTTVILVTSKSLTMEAYREVFSAVLNSSGIGENITTIRGARNPNLSPNVNQIIDTRNVTLINLPVLRLF